MRQWWHGRDSREKGRGVCMPDVRWPNDFVGIEIHVCSKTVRQFSENANVSCKCVMPMCHANMSYYTTHKKSVWTPQPLFSGIHLLATAWFCTCSPEISPKVFLLINKNSCTGAKLSAVKVHLSIISIYQIFHNASSFFHVYEIAATALHAKPHKRISGC